MMYFVRELLLLILFHISSLCTYVVVYLSVLAAYMVQYRLGPRGGEGGGGAKIYIVTK